MSFRPRDLAGRWGAALNRRCSGAKDSGLPLGKGWRPSVLRIEASKLLFPRLHDFDVSSVSFLAGTTLKSRSWKNVHDIAQNPLAGMLRAKAQISVKSTIIHGPIKAHSRRTNTPARTGTGAILFLTGVMTGERRMTSSETNQR
jgi:hypothetical protein